MRKYIILLGITAVLLFMLPVSMALARTVSPITINNGAELTANIATPDTTVFSNVDGITVSTGAELKSAGIARMMTAQITSGIIEEVASTADVKTINGKNVDGATEVTAQNENTANFRDNLSVMNANSPAVTRNNTKSSINISGITMTNGSFNSADAHHFNEVAYVLKIVIPAGVNTGNKPLVESAITISQTADRAPVTTLKKPINLVENNTGALTTLTTNSLVNTAINTPTASATIEYSILQTGQTVRTLVHATINQATTHMMTPANVISTTSGITTPNMAMINSAAAIYFTDITVTAMVQNQENAAYANDLVVAGIKSEIILVDAIADTAMGRAPTTTYSGTFAFDIAGAGLVTMSFV